MPVSLFLYGLQKSMDVISIDCYFHCTVYDLREMNIGGFEFSDVQDIFIPQLSREEIEERIQREDNPKVREGLRMLAEGRENYSYDSRTDEHYVNTFANETKGRGR